MLLLSFCTVVPAFSSILLLALLLLLLLLVHASHVVLGVTFFPVCDTLVILYILLPFAFPHPLMVEPEAALLAM